MKIAIASTGRRMSDSVFELFGRCPCFILAEVENGKILKTEVLENESENQSSGAGISSARLLAENNVKVIIVKTVGPRAVDVLRQFDIDVQSGEGKIEDVLRDFIDKKIKK